ncbi:RodZ domain-containing protein, partial [Vibrio harveyi]
IVITGISAAWWWQNQQENSLAQLSSETAETEHVANDADIDQMSADELIASTPAEIAPVSAAPAVVSEADTTMSATDEGMAESTVTPTAEAVEETAQEPVAVIEDAQAAEEPITPVIPEGMTLLTMKFKADCWIQVKDANGKTLVSGTRKPGQDVELAGKAPFKVILGAPEGVTMTFASEPVDLSGYTSGKVARFTLPL